MPRSYPILCAVVLLGCTEQHLVRLTFPGGPDAKSELLAVNDRVYALGPLDAVRDTEAFAEAPTLDLAALAFDEEVVNLGLNPGLQSVAVGAGSVLAARAFKASIVDGVVGPWVASDSTDERIDPYRPRIVLAELQRGGAEIYSCFLSKAGFVYCAGYDREQSAGPLNPGSSRPVQVPGLSGVQQLALGLHHFCALRDGKVACIGSNRAYQLGSDLADVAESQTPREVPNLSDVIEIDAHGNRTCALTRAGRVLCWGRYGDSDLRTRLPTDIAFPVAIEHISVGTYMVIGLAQGKMYWVGRSGLQPYPGTGCNDPSHSSISDEVRSFDLPAALSGLRGHVSDVRMADENGCFRTDGNDVYCWGCNRVGQIGTGTISDSLTFDVAPTKVASSIRRISVGPRASCGISQTSRLSCWGGNHAHLISSEQLDLPQRATERGQPDAVDLQVFGSHACMMHRGGQLDCWGRSDCGQLGQRQVSSRDCSTNADVPDALPVDF
ncbi:MAG: hypothetical protein U1E65_31400 [Myxococcota bacterium]